jgi:sugar phosphate isomerase/epimerase
MKLGMMIYSLGRALADGQLTVPGALALMKELGVEGVDMSTWHVQGLTASTVREMVADAGLVISSYIGGADLTTGPGPLRSAALDELRKVIDDAAEAEAKCVLVTTGICVDGQDRAEGRRNVAAGLAQLLPYVKERRLVLTIEDFGALQSPYQTSDECLETCEMAGPELMMTYDSGNMVLGDEDPVAFLEAVKLKVVHAHAKDWALQPADFQGGLPSRAGKRYVGTVCGQGVIDYPAVIGALKKIGYGGYLSFEYEGSGDSVAAAKEGTAYLLNLMR